MSNQGLWRSTNKYDFQEGNDLQGVNREVEGKGANALPLPPS